MFKKSPNLVWWMPLIITTVLLGIYFRFVNLDNKVYWIDEVHTSLRVSGYTRTEFENNNLKGVITIDDLHKFQRLSPERDFNDTIKALASSEHSPLYYILTRFWMDWFGSSISVTRSLAAIISLLAFPCIYWLSFELFNYHLISRISLALLAVSPFHVIYAQEAREYSLLTVAILFSSASFIYAVKHQTKVNWIVYGGGVTIALYTHPLAALVIFGQGIYLLITDGLRFTKTLRNYILSCLGAVVAFIPWILVFIHNGDGVGDWVTKSLSISTIFQRWLLNISSLFFDLQVGYNQALFDVENGNDIQLSISQPIVYLLIPILFIVIYSLYFLALYAPKQAKIFIFTLIGVTGIILVLPDLISGGQRSTIGRYMIPCFLGIQLSVAYCLGKLVTGIDKPLGAKNFGRFLTVIILSMGIICCTIMAQTPTWWNKYSSYYNAQVASIINKYPHSLVITNRPRSSRITSLSYKLSPQVKILLVERNEKVKIADNYDKVFLYRPYGELWDYLNQKQYKLTELHSQGYLWEITK